MINSNNIEVDIKKVEKLVKNYIQQNFSPIFLVGGGGVVMGAAGIIGIIYF